MMIWFKCIAGWCSAERENLSTEDFRKEVGGLRTMPVGSMFDVLVLWPSPFAIKDCQKSCDRNFVNSADLTLYSPLIFFKGLQVIFCSPFFFRVDNRDAPLGFSGLTVFYYYENILKEMSATVGRGRNGIDSGEGAKAFLGYG
jgi:hypothetical protein